MTLTLYTTSSERNRIGKSLVQQIQITGTLRAGDSGNMINPTITIESTAANISTVLSCNYAYITEYNRYYFIGDKKTVSDKLVELPLECDVLESFKTSILENDVLVGRSEQNTSDYISDGQRPLYNFPMVLTKEFPYGMNSLHFYLTVATSYEGS